MITEETSLVDVLIEVEKANKKVIDLTRRLTGILAEEKVIEAKLKELRSGSSGAGERAS